MKEKLDIFFIHVALSNITHRIFQDYNVDKLTDEIFNIDKICRQHGVKDVAFSSIFVKSSIKLG